MKQQFVIRGYYAFSEQDSWEDGCSFDTAKYEFMPPEAWTNKANSFDELLDMLSDEFKSNDFLLNSCEEPGRLDLQVMQRDPFQCNKVSKETEDKWKAGKLNLWLTCYTFKVEIVQTEIDLTKYTDRKFN